MAVFRCRRTLAGPPVTSTSDSGGIGNVLSKEAAVKISHERPFRGAQVKKKATMQNCAHRHLRCITGPVLSPPAECTPEHPH